MPAPSSSRGSAALPEPPGASGGVSKKPERPPTPYEQRVYQMCKAIPEGKVSTYGDMAKALGSAPRAVGQAMRRNPFAPVVPCHRVVAADLNLGGFSGSWGSACGDVQRKKGMLQQEGVQFEGDRVASDAFVVRSEELRRLVGQQEPKQQGKRRGRG